MKDDTISRKTAIEALWKALYKYEDETEKRFQESDELDISDWFIHRMFITKTIGIGIRVFVRTYLLSGAKTKLTRLTMQ